MTKWSHIGRYIASSLIVMSLCLTSLALASGGDDWVLVKRFNEQLSLAQANNPQAMYEVGRMYERGRGTPADMDQAIAWYERAAVKGQDNARARLGILYLEGQGVSRDYSKAFSYLKDAAVAGAPSAQYFLALMYEHGSGIKANEKYAMVWYKRAANAGYYQARKGIERLSARAKRPSLPQPPSAKPQTPAKQPAKAAAPKLDLAKGLLETVLSGRWVRNGRAAGFLPSANTTCSEEANVIKCLSSEQTRNTGYSEITYVTIARLSNFSANDEFTVKYQNNVLRTQSLQQEETDVASADDDEDYSAASVAGTAATLSKHQTTRHELECSLKNEKKLICVKDSVRTLTFTNSAASS